MDNDIIPIIQSKLKSKKIKVRGVEDLGDGRFNVKAEVRGGTTDAVTLLNTLKPLGLRKVNGAYGRWIFKSRDY